MPTDTCGLSLHLLFPALPVKAQAPPLGWRSPYPRDQTQTRPPACLLLLPTQEPLTPTSPSPETTGLAVGRQNPRGQGRNSALSRSRCRFLLPDSVTLGKWPHLLEVCVKVTCDNEYNFLDDKNKSILKKNVMGNLPYCISKFIQSYNN